LKPGGIEADTFGAFVEAGRKPRTGLKLDVTTLESAAVVESRQGENPERD